MKRIYYYIGFSVLFFISCNQTDVAEEKEEKGVVIQLFAESNYTTRVVDANNLASEQVINNISLFLTEPSTTAITHKFVYTGFTVSGDYQLINLPLQPADLLTKDIYVIANYDSESALNGVTSLDNIRALFTPEVDAMNNLVAGMGFCMYGSLAGFDFTDEQTYPATVPLIRTCAKLRVNLTFPGNPELSTTNNFLIQNAAGYTYVVKNATSVLPQSDYFNFAAPVPLVDNGSQTYTNIVYVYEATQPPVMTLYVEINAIEQQEFTTNLPVPQRNYLYDLNVRVYEDTPAAAVRSSAPGYIFESDICVYDETGRLVEKISR